MRTSFIVFTAALAAVSTPALAEVAEAGQDHFITRNEAVVDATPKETWLALISPARWWSSEHTWSADAANLTLTPQAGGCFCERIPEVEDANRITLEGSVEHMRVIQAYPEVALRMQGALGPLQSEPVTGVLTIAISEVDQGTRIVWEYNVGGKMRYPVPVISQAVDGVMTLQLTRLSERLGVVIAPVQPDRAADTEKREEGGSPEDQAEEDPVAIDPEAVIGSEAAQTDRKPNESDESGSTTVDEAFDDLSQDNNPS